MGIVLYAVECGTRMMGPTHLRLHFKLRFLICAPSLYTTTTNEQPLISKIALSRLLLAMATCEMKAVNHPSLYPSEV